MYRLQKDCRKIVERRDDIGKQNRADEKRKKYDTTGPWGYAFCFKADYYFS